MATQTSDPKGFWLHGIFHKQLDSDDDYELPEELFIKTGCKYSSEYDVWMKEHKEQSAKTAQDDQDAQDADWWRQEQAEKEEKEMAEWRAEKEAEKEEWRLLVATIHQLKAGMEATKAADGTREKTFVAAVVLLILILLLLVVLVALIWKYGEHVTTTKSLTCG